MKKISRTILVVDDDQASLFVLVNYLKKLDFSVIPATSGQEALSALELQDVDLIISDLIMSDMDGIALLGEIRKIPLNIPFIVVTACGSVESAVAAIQQGAYDYLEKPINLDKLQFSVQRALNHYHALFENRQIKAYLEEHFTFQNLVTVNPSMKTMLEMAAKVTESPQTTIAIYGESGTGKEMLAKAIHFASTGMPTGFVAINCAAIPEQLMESELFGHIKGAFTGADIDREGKFSQAKGGTLLLDEIGDLPLPLQAKLLRVLQERSFEKVGDNKSISLNCRIIAATNIKLKLRVESGTFREDLFHRINIFPLHIPPLRERKEDICSLCMNLLAELRQHLGKQLPGISQLAMDAILAYDWPGNVRELRNRLERAAILTSKDLILPEHLGLQQSTQRTDILHDEIQQYTTYMLKMPTQSVSLAALTSQILSQTLEHQKGNKSKAAEFLKIGRKMFYRY